MAVCMSVKAGNKHSCAVYGGQPVNVWSVYGHYMVSVWSMVQVDSRCGLTSVSCRCRWAVRRRRRRLERLPAALVVHG